MAVNGVCSRSNTAAPTSAGNHDTPSSSLHGCVPDGAASPPELLDQPGPALRAQAGDAVQDADGHPLAPQGRGG